MKTFEPKSGLACQQRFTTPPEPPFYGSVPRHTGSDKGRVLRQLRVRIVSLPLPS